MAKNNKAFVLTLEQNFQKLPALPSSVKQFLVTVIPWLALIFGIIVVLGALSAFGFSTLFSPLIAISAGIGDATFAIVSSLIALAQAVLALIAFPSLLKRRLAGWNLLFWSEVLAVVAAVIGLSISGIIFALIGFYLLFQIKPYYK